jgi:hemoglobin-like flavoprotein
MTLLTDQQKQLVQFSFREISPIGDEVSATFYDQLFSMAPTVRSLFPVDLTEQRRKLMYTLTLVVANLRDLDAIAPTIEALGRRHVEYGAEPAHYEVVGQALIFALSQGLGAAFNDDVKQAWIAAYAAIQSIMLKAAQESG